jgi:hypothetical protein
LKTLTIYLKDKENSTYCLKLDVKQFYKSVDNNILKKLLRTKFKDLDLLNLLDNIIDSIEGLPLGSYTSQWFANFYLNNFNHWLKEIKQVKKYLLYCDDIVILHSDKKYLSDLRVEIQNYLFDNLKLELSNYQVFPVSKRGIDFLGYKSYHTHIFLRKSIKLRWQYMLKNYPNKKSKSSYYGWLCHANTINLQRKYLTK